MGYRPRTNLVKYKNDDQLVDFHNILNGWKKYYSQLLKVHNISDVRQIEMHTTKPLVRGSSPFEVEIAKLKKL
jgi:hypothetical protein